MERIAKSVTSICAAETVAQLQEALQKSVERFGFQSYNLSFRKKDGREFMTAPTVTNWATRDLERYADEGWVDRDPLLEMAVRPSDPVAWAPDLWTFSAEHAAYGEFLASTGIISGATAPLDQREETLSAMTALSFVGLPKSQTDAYAIQTLGRVAVVRAAVLGIAGADVTNARYLNRLSSRQMEILQWATRGKSNTDIAVIIGSSKRAVDYHVAEILKKLEVSTKAQAAAIFSAR